MEKTLRQLIEDKGVPTLKAFALALEVQPNRIYNVSKTPVEGQAYDPTTVNYEAVEKFIARRIGNEGDKFANLEQVVDAALEIQNNLANSDRRKISRGSKIEKIALGDKLIPARRFDPNIDEEVYLKQYPGKTFAVVLKTETHIALQVKGTTELVALSNWTFNQKGLNPISDAGQKFAESWADLFKSPAEDTGTLEPQAVAENEDEELVDLND